MVSIWESNFRTWRPFSCGYIRSCASPKTKSLYNAEIIAHTLPTPIGCGGGERWTNGCFAAENQELTEEGSALMHFSHTFLCVFVYLIFIFLCGIWVSKQKQFIFTLFLHINIKHAARKIHERVDTLYANATKYIVYITQC